IMLTMPGRRPSAHVRAPFGRNQLQRRPATNPVLHQAIMDIVDNQLRDNTPPETRQTLERLIADGQTLDNARRLIGCVVSTQIYDILAQHQLFDKTAYVAALQRLPDEESAGS